MQQTIAKNKAQQQAAQQRQQKFKKEQKGVVELGFDPSTGYTGVDPSTVPSYLGGTKDTTVSPKQPSPKQPHIMESFWQEATATETAKVMDPAGRTDVWGGGQPTTTQAQTEQQIQIL